MYYHPETLGALEHLEICLSLIEVPRLFFVLLYLIRLHFSVISGMIGTKSGYPSILDISMTIICLLSDLGCSSVMKATP